MEAEHICSDKDIDLERMQSSKYVQSRISDCYLKIKESLLQGRKVLFCGTPCQTAGLHFYLGKLDTSNLLSVSLICHGVPSPLVWSRYKDALEKKYKGKLVHVNHRDKSYKGYSESYCKYSFAECQNSTNVWNVGMPTYLSDPYVFLFTDNLYIRNSCTQCKYKADHSKADIIVGDYYASTKDAGCDGSSCVISMTEKGKAALLQVDGKLEPTSIINAVGTNSMLWKSVSKSKYSKKFFQEFSKYSVGDMSLFTDFLPFRFKVKKTLNQLGFFTYWQKLKYLKHKRNN